MTKIIIPLPQKVPGFLIGELTSKLAYLDETIQRGSVSDSGDTIEVEVKGPVLASTQKKIQEKTSKLAASLISDGYKPKELILEDFLSRKTTFNQNPTQKLLKNGDIFQEASGIYSYGPHLTKLIEFLDEEFIDLANSFCAAPYRFPTLVPAKFLERVNYFHAFPHSLSFATHLREDLDVIQDFSANTRCTENGLSTPADSFSPINTLLSPAVCYHLYFSLADSTLQTESLVATAVGNCFRYESINLNSLERLWNFTMREVIFMGSKEFVLEQRETGRKRMADKFRQMGLAYKVESANDPFFIGEYKQAAFQNAFKLKFEIRANLPFKNDTLAIGSYNYHQDFFGRQLNIKQQTEKPVHTGCIAFGLERVAFAFLSQFGLDVKDWPEYIRKAVQ